MRTLKVHLKATQRAAANEPKSAWWVSWSRLWLRLFPAAINSTQEARFNFPLTRFPSYAYHSRPVKQPSLCRFQVSEGPFAPRRSISSAHLHLARLRFILFIYFLELCKAAKVTRHIHACQVLPLLKLQKRLWRYISHSSLSVQGFFFFFLKCTLSSQTSLRSVLAAVWLACLAAASHFRFKQQTHRLPPKAPSAWGHRQWKGQISYYPPWLLTLDSIRLLNKASKGSVVWSHCG